MAEQGWNSNQMPSLWVFLIIVLAVLLGVVLGTSCVMHLVQRRQRTQLRRRIASGEVDLETLGIKRLNVPQETIQKMPQYTFKSVGENSSGTDVSASGSDEKFNNFYQPTCSICLDDFVYNETQVRELPCKHIFHPECIDPFLRDNSSLCPLCKRSALPSGMCPVQVTNVMVRRERLTRRMRDSRQGIRRSFSRHHTAGIEPSRWETRWERRLNRMRGPPVVSVPPPAVVRNDSMAHGAVEVIPDPVAVEPQRDTELGPLQSSDTILSNIEQPPPDIARRGTQARRAWRRERVASMHVRQYNEQAEEAEREDARRPLWRRAIGLN